MEQKEELEQKHLHLLQILDSERQSKWQYVQQTEELGQEVKKIRTEVSLSCFKYHMVTLGVSWYHSVCHGSLGVTWLHLVCHGFIGCVMVSLGGHGFIGCVMVTFGVIWLHWCHMITLGVTWFHCMSHGYIGCPHRDYLSY